MLNARAVGSQTWVAALADPGAKVKCSTGALRYQLARLVAAQDEQSPILPKLVRYPTRAVRGTPVAKLA